MASADVDVGFLSAHLGVPEQTIVSVTSDPTADLVKAVLQAVIAKAHEFNELSSDRLRLDIELESTIRSSEARSESFKATAEKALKDVEELRQKLKSEENARQALENELQSLKSSNTTSQSDLSTLRARITSLETSNRETLAVLDAKSTANSELSDELQKQHQKNVKLGQEITALGQNVQQAQATANSAKYREQSLQQELELAKRNVEWFENELRTKSAEALKYRKEKGARIAELQRLNEEATSTIESLQRGEQQLRARVSEAQAQADDALARAQQLQEAAARTDEAFKQELDASKRLVQLKEQQMQTQKDRLRDVELRLEQVKDEAESEVRRVRQELEKEKEGHSTTQQRVQELEAETDRLQVLVSENARPSGSVPQTPRANGSTFGRAASPFVTPGSAMGKSGTQLIDELYRVKGELVTERRVAQQMREGMESALQHLEALTPRLDALEKENESLRQEIVSNHTNLGGVFQDMEAAKKAARRVESGLKAAQAEAELLRSQVRDLSAQIQLLVFNEHARKQGLDELTVDDVREYDELQRREVVKDSLEDMSHGNRLISEKYVVFKDIHDLQQKNQELLRATRELVKTMEDDEDIAAQHVAARDREEVEALQSQVTMLQEKVQSLGTVVEGAERQRDMFRRLLQRRATAEEIHSALDISGDAGSRGVLASIEPNSTPEAADMSVAYRDLQNQYDTYRKEQEIDRRTLREQTDKLSGEKSALQADVSRITSQLTLASERYEMLNSNYVALQTENRELQRRNQTSSESATKQDIRTQQVVEDLVEARGLAESMRNETANLKAEKDLWQRLKERFAADNETLQQEKARLSSLLATQQSLQNERELSESETRRRLQTQVDSLSSELTTSRRKLAEEVEERKQLQLRKEYDAQQFQKRVDELTATLAQIKEENVATKTSRDHLQARVNELTIELRNAEERTERLRPQLTSRSQAAGAAATTADDDDSETRMRELSDEISDLKRDLDLAKTHLENARAQAEQYKGLCQAAEEELASFNSAQDQYRQETDAILATNDTRIKELEHRVEDLSSELARSNSELSTVRDSQAEVARRYEEEKRIIEAEVARLKDDNDRHTEAGRYHHQDLRAQADIATKAQQDYEEELVKHAEATRQLQTVRADFNKLKTQTSSLRAEADAAKLSLAQAENSAEERRQALEQEVADLTARKDDTNAQNRLLHQQLDSLTAQLASLQRSRTSTGEPESMPSAITADADKEGLRELINYLRREKEILEVQYEVKVQESSRLQQQVQYSQSQLDETRLKLEQERRSQADTNRITMTHKELMDKLNELNLIRESNVTLRNELQHAQAVASERSAKIEELERVIQPLEARISELDSQKSFLEADFKQLQEDRDRWQKRTESILSKYGRVDPEEQEQLKQSISTLESERDSLAQSEQQLKEKVQELEAAVETEKAARNTLRERLGEQFKERSKRLTTEKAQVQEQLTGATARITALEQELESTKSDRSSMAEKVAQLEEQAQRLSSTGQPLPPSASTQQASAEWEQQLRAARQELELVVSQKAELYQQLEDLRVQLAQAIAQRDEAVTQAQAHALAQSQGLTDGQDTAKAGQDQTPRPAPSGLDGAEQAALQAKVAEAEAVLQDFDKKVEAKADAVSKARADKMKEQLNNRLRESREKLNREMEEQRAKLDQEFKLKMEQERAIWLAEQKGMAQEGQNGVPASPVKQGDSVQPQDPQTPTAAQQLVDMAKLTDNEVRALLATNATLRGIVASNIKKKVDTETQKMRETVEQSVKSDMDQRLKDAREQATMMVSKKSTLQLNMMDNRFRAAVAKLNVVETAARDTPERPVGEVWAIAKDAKPAAPSPSPAQPGSPAASPAADHQAGSLASSIAPMNGGEAKLPPPSSGLPQPPKPTLPAPSPRAPAAMTGAPVAAAANPFATSSAPVGSKPAQAINPFATPAAQAQALPQQPQRTGIPQPARGGGGGRGGGRGGLHPNNNAPAVGQAVYQPPGQRSVSGPGRGGRGGARGGAAGGPGGGLNPSADNFNPGAGNKRPRGDSEAGAGGQKRQRGGGGGGAAH